MPETVHVAVAAIVNDNDEVCISLRHEDAHQGGLWEFPGGKIEATESDEQALVREVKEELNLTVSALRPLITISHQYPDKLVCLHVYKVDEYQGHASGAEGQPVRWVAISALADYAFPAANSPIIKALQLPDRYLITGKFSDSENFVKKLAAALSHNIKLVQLRLKTGSFDDVEQSVLLISEASKLCKQADAALMLNVPDNCLSEIESRGIVYSGIHADSKMLRDISRRPAGKLFSASCHNAEELNKAVSLGADFALLSPVQKTASHPDMDAMGWQAFSELVTSVELPVYALGGVSTEDLETAWRSGAQGIAAISALWEVRNTN